jgi:NTP pyrophosphatase (non-canonical NTP hydrolase)
MYNPMNDVKEFHDTFAPDQRNDSFLGKTLRRTGLITEEYQEVIEALEFLEDTYCGMTSFNPKDAKEEVAKELADLLYVVYGTAEELNIPLQEVFEAVHKSNMSKANPDGTVSRNEFGKVLKPDTYVKPDLSFINDNRFL